MTVDDLKEIVEEIKKNHSFMFPNGRVVRYMHCSISNSLFPGEITFLAIDHVGGRHEFEKNKEEVLEFLKGDDSQGREFNFNNYEKEIQRKYEIKYEELAKA